MIDPIDITKLSTYDAVQAILKRSITDDLLDGPCVIAFVSISRVEDPIERQERASKLEEIYQELWPLLVERFVDYTKIPIAPGQPAVDLAKTSGVIKGTQLSIQLMEGTHHLSAKTSNPEDTAKLFITIMAKKRIRAVMFSLFVGNMPFDSEGYMNIDLSRLEQHQLP